MDRWIDEPLFRIRHAPASGNMVDGSESISALEFIEKKQEGQMQLPTIEEAGVIAVRLCEYLPEQDQAMFIAGFQEAIKFLMSNHG